MASALQKLTLVVTFLVAVLLGAIFDMGYWQASIIAKENLGDVPLPRQTTFFSANHGALFYLPIVPWIAFAGLPFLNSTKKYFDTDLFLLRFAAFASFEILLSLILLLFLVLPFVPYYAILEPRTNTLLETLVIVGFWIFVSVVVLYAVRNWQSIRSETQAEK